MVKVTSKEITYRSVIEQVFFDDESELIIKTGWAENQEFDLDVDLEWIPEVPEWAKNLTKDQILKLVDVEI